MHGTALYTMLTGKKASNRELGQQDGFSLLIVVAVSPLAHHPSP
jgi:hypothetical protein